MSHVRVLSCNSKGGVAAVPLRAHDPVVSGAPCVLREEDPLVHW